MSKTMIPINGKGYKIVTGEIASSSTDPLTLTFESKVACIMFRHTVTNNSSVTNELINFSCDANSSFFKEYSDVVNQITPSGEDSKSYIYNTAAYSYCKRIDEYTFEFDASTSGYKNTKVIYVAIVEDTDINDSIFLLNGTILYTDGTPSSTITGAIQTVDTNKYKIKSNALVNISNATYIDLSN